MFLYWGISKGVFEFKERYIDYFSLRTRISEFIVFQWYLVEKSKSMRRRGKFLVPGYINFAADVSVVSTDWETIIDGSQNGECTGVCDRYVFSLQLIELNFG